MNLVWKLLRTHLSPAQLVGFFLANLTGMAIVLLCLQLSSDLRPLFEGGDSFLKKDYLILTKKVSTWGMLSGKDNTFTEQEIQEIREQPFVKKIAGFHPSRFRVIAGIELRGHGFATEMFFESVPDEFIDVHTEDWRFDEKKRIIPIILPRNYLNLYNFGFAQSRNLPKLSENVIGMLQLDIEVRGNGKRENYIGKIVGFSNRLNTILVPEEFMQQANRAYAPDQPLTASRLILETGNPADKQISRFLQRKGYESEAGKADAGKTVWFLNILTASVLAVGILICLLAFYILMLSIYLLLQKNSTKLENLLLIGYSVRQIARPYQGLAFFMNGVVLLTACGIVFILRHYYIAWLKEVWPEFTAGSTVTLWITGIALFIFVSVLNGMVIREKIRKL